MSDTEKRERLAKLIAHFDTSMLVTKMSDGRLRSRPLAVATHAGTAELLFSTAIDSPKVGVLEHDPHVNVVMQEKRCFVSITGRARISRDRVLIERLWSESWKVFFVSVRWGQTNSLFQRLFERLSWIENRVSTLGEAPIPQLKKLEAGIVLFGHNWNDEQVLKTQKQNFKWFGWKTPAALSFNWQYTKDAEKESPESYLDAIEEFGALLLVGLHDKPTVGPFIRRTVWSKSLD